MRANTNPGAPRFSLPPTAAPGNPGENEPRPQTVAEPRRLRLPPPQVARAGGVQTKPTAETLAPLAPERTLIAGRPSPRSKRTQRPLARSRVGAEGPISHPKHRHRLRTWTGSAVFAHNAETDGRYP